MAVVDTVRTTLGPRGMDKLIYNEKARVRLLYLAQHMMVSQGSTISNDGATIMKMLDIVHPAARILCDISLAQDAEVGDGTTTVVILAGELLKEAKPYIEEGVHPQLLIKAYRQAAQLAVEYVKGAAINLGDKPRDELRELLEKCAQTSLNSKLVR